MEYRTRARRVDLFIVAGALLGYGAARAGRPAETDPYWQIRAGLDQLAGAPLARPDAWSWAPVDGLFYPNSPGWNLLLGLAWQAAAFPGFFLLSWAAIAAYLALAYLVARWLGARPLPALAGVAIVSVLAVPMLSPRATIVVESTLLLALAWPLWWRRSGAGLGPLVGTLVPFGVGFGLSLVGNWLHLSWLAWAPAVALAWAAYWLFCDLEGAALEPGRPRFTDPRRWRPLLGGGAGLFGGWLLSPYGVSGGWDRAKATQEAADGLLIEWLSPFTPGLSTQWPVAAVAAGALAVGLVAWGVHAARRQRTELLARLATFGVLIVPTAVAGLVSIRFLGVALLTGAPVLGLALTALARRVRSWAIGRSQAAPLQDQALRWSSARSWRIVAGAVVALLLPGAVAFGANLGRPAAADAVALLPPDCRLFAPASVADVSVLLRPDVRVWFDGRADYYGRQRILETGAYLRGQGATTVPPGTSCVLLPAPDEGGPYGGLVARLGADPAWLTGTRIAGHTLWLPADA